MDLRRNGMMRRYPLKLASLLGLVLIIAFITPQRAVADDDDPPSRVARLSYSAGSVSFQPAGTDDWVSAVVNRPITTGDKLWTDNGSRAELNIDSATVRIAENTGFSFLNLADNSTQIQLTSGTLRIRVKRLDDDENFEIDTPNLAFSIVQPGVYRIHVNENGDSTMIRVWSGEGDVTGEGSEYTVHAREVATFNGLDQLDARFSSQEYGEDNFDQWCADRDRHEDLSVSRRYVSEDVIGYEDLDDNGGWRNTPDYGNVWFPHTTVVGWAPYKYGHWAYISPWGYTWVDDAPWGFAPFHYGRWVNYSGVWGWVPCPPRAPNVVYVRPVYAPALVAWVGGPQFGVGLSVGWFPLGPREVFVPSYPVSRTYITKVNVSNTTVNTTVINNYYNTTVVNRNTTVVNNNVTVFHQTYANQNVAGAVTATSHQAFTSAQSVSRNNVAVNMRDVASAQVSASTPAVPPAKQAVLGSGKNTTVHPPAAIQNRAIVAKVQPPPPPVSFTRQQEAIQANGGRPIGVSQTRQIQTTQPAPPQQQRQVRIAPPANNVQNNRSRQGNNQPGGQPFNGSNRPGNPGNAGQAQPVTPTNNGQQGGRPGAPNNAGQTQPVAPANNGQQGGNKPSNASGNSPSNTNGGNPNQGNQSGGQPSTGNNRPGAPNNAGQTQPVAPGNNGQQGGSIRPSNVQDNPSNGVNGGNQNQGGNQRNLNDRPPAARTNGNGGGNPAANVNPQTNQRQDQLDQKHQQQTEQLRNKQDQERQKVEQQQIQDRQKTADKAPSDPKQQQLNQKQQQQLQSLEKKHDDQDQKLQQKQQVERKAVAPPPPAKPEPAKPDKDKDKKKDKDH
jgi:hypothetical protein